MKKSINKNLTTTLAVVLLSSSIPTYTFAAKFNDVPQKHWGYTSIESMADKGYLNGMGDGSFNPAGKLTFIQSMSALTNLRKPTAGDKIKATSSYGAIIDGHNIKDQWKKEPLCLALYQGIISENELSNIVKNKMIDSPLPREMVSVYIARAIGLEDEAQNKSVVHVPYKDNASIRPETVRYIAVLLDVGVLNPKGTGDGYFEPKAHLNRAELAAMLARADEYLIKNPLTNTNSGVDGKDPVKPVEDNKTVTKTITIKRITDDLGRKIVVAEDSSGDEEGFFVQSSTDIRVNGKSSDVKDLDKGQRVEIKYNNTTKNLISISAEVKQDDRDKEKEEKYDGTVYYMNTGTKKMTIEYQDGKNTSKKDLTFDSDTYVYTDGKKGSIKDIKEGDLVKVKTRGDYIYDIESSSKTLKIEKGLIKEINRPRNSKKNEIEIKVEDRNEKIYTIVTDSKTKVYRKRRSVDPDELKVKDTVYVDAEYDKDLRKYLAHEIDSDVEKKSVEGYVLSVTTKLNQNPSIVIRNDDTGKEETYTLANDAYIKVDKNVVSSLPSTPGYYAELEIEGDEIVEVFADSTSLDTAVVGKIKYINYSKDIIELEIENINNNDKSRKLNVYLENDTIILNRNGSRYDIRDLYKGDLLSVTGKYKGNNFVADSILVR